MGNVSMINGHIDNVVSDEDIVKALECCIKDDYDKIRNALCAKCPYCKNTNCKFLLQRDTLDLINRLKADKEALIKGQESLMKHLERKKEIITELDNEVEELSYRNKELLKAVHYYHDSKIDSIKRAKSEAIKKFAERFKEKAGSIVTSCQGYEIYETKQYQISAINFDNLVEEMIGGETDV